VGAGNRAGVGNGTGVGAGTGASDGSGTGNGNSTGDGNNGNDGGGPFGFGQGFGASALTLGPDSGLLVPPFGQFMVTAPQPAIATLYNVALITVRNGTSQTFTAKSGLSVGVAGSAGTEPFLTGNQVWKPGQVIVFYSLDEATFPPDFTFNLDGASTEVPANIYYGIQYSPNTLPGILDSIVSSVLVGGRYAVAAM
jgi:hypothetical protein